MVHYHSLYELSPVITGWTICVMVLRVYKKWINKSSFQLRLVLVDESGTQIEATIDRCFSEFYFEKIKENQWKSITIFRVRPNSEKVKATSHTYGIWFVDETCVTSAYPRETVLFNRFTPFDYIVEDTVPTNTLIDIIGADVYVGSLTNNAPDRADIYGYRIPFKLMDRNQVILRCEATGQTVLDFDRSYHRFGHPNIVLALAWWRIERNAGRPQSVKIVSHGPISKVFSEPDIEEVKEIKIVVD